MASELTLRQFLCVPYLVEAETVAVEGGRWVRRAAYPELPGCQVESATIEEALERLECRRVECIVEMLLSGSLPPMPRPPLPDADPLGVMRRLGFGRETTDLLDRSATWLAAGGR